MENHTIECNKQCEQESSEISSGCEDKSCECASTDEKSAECVTLCRSDSSSCEDNCSVLEIPTIDIKLNRRQQNALCEIRDFHHRRQKSRLAKMRAISAASAAAAVASHTDVLRSRTSRRRPRIMTKKLYNLLAAELPRSKGKKSRKITEYLLKRRSGLNKIKGDGRKRRKEREEIYRLRKKMARKLKNKRLSGDTYGQLERIPQQNVISKH